MESEIEIIDTDSKGLFEKAKDWSYENWQTLLIILIVLIIGISAYNYNQNNANNNSTHAIVDSENESSGDFDNNQNDKIADNNSEENNQEIIAESIDRSEAMKEDEKTEDLAKKETTDTSTNTNKKETISNKNDSGKQYIETAVSGDGITHLARKAIGEYIQETGDGSSLSKEQKIYAEDYMQNRTGSDKIEIGHQETFSESLIKEAISRANGLSKKDLENITKYIK